jgi:hypothetical protein
MPGATTRITHIDGVALTLVVDAEGRGIAENTLARYPLISGSGVPSAGPLAPPEQSRCQDREFRSAVAMPAALAAPRRF